MGNVGYNPRKIVVVVEKRLGFGEFTWGGWVGYGPVFGKGMMTPFDLGFRFVKKGEGERVLVEKYGIVHGRCRQESTQSKTFDLKGVGDLEVVGNFEGCLRIFRRISYR